jgi:hypothetical protein
MKQLNYREIAESVLGKFLDGKGDTSMDEVYESMKISDKVPYVNFQRNVAAHIQLLLEEKNITDEIQVVSMNYKLISKN